MEENRKVGCRDGTSLLKRYGQVQFNELTSGQGAVKLKGANRNGISMTYTK